MTSDEVARATERWVLAFDGSCGTCRDISRVVDEACAGRLEVLPLTYPQVEQWRQAAFGADAPFTPTLLLIRADGEVRGWTSRRMAVPLARRLGVRASLRVLTAIGELREQVHQPLISEDRPRTLSRKAFLRLGTGATVAGGLLFAGAAPAFAEQRRSAAAAWAAANRGRLPQTYGSMVEYSLDYRRAIYAELPSATRAGLWREHLRAYRSAHPPTTADQKRVIAAVDRYVADESVFDDARPPARVGADQRLVTQVIAVFGADEAERMLATLGPSAGAGSPRAEFCSCASQSSFCRLETWCQYRSACERQDRCGAWWQYICDGHCFRTG